MELPVAVAVADLASQSRQSEKAVFGIIIMGFVAARTAILTFYRSNGYNRSANMEKDCTHGDTRWLAVGSLSVPSSSLLYWGVTNVSVTRATLLILLGTLLPRREGC